MAKDLKYFESKLTALRNAHDDLLREMAEELAKTESAKVPRKRQNHKETRVLNFDAFYSARRKAK